MPIEREPEGVLWTASLARIDERPTVTYDDDNSRALLA
jgi:hypothetical protein